MRERGYGFARMGWAALVLPLLLAVGNGHAEESLMEALKRSEGTTQALVDARRIVVDLLGNLNKSQQEVDPAKVRRIEAGPDPLVLPGPGQFSNGGDVFHVDADPLKNGAIVDISGGVQARIFASPKGADMSVVTHHQGTEQWFVGDTRSGAVRSKDSEEAAMAAAVFWQE